MIDDGCNGASAGSQRVPLRDWLCQGWNSALQRDVLTDVSGICVPSTSSDPSPPPEPSRVQKDGPLCGAFITLAIVPACCWTFVELLLAFRAETSINIKMKTVTGCRQERTNNERGFFSAGVMVKCMFTGRLDCLL